MPLLPSDLLACLFGLAGWPFTWLVGYRFGYLAGRAAAPRRIIQWGLDLPASVATPVLVEREAGSYARLSWDLLTVRQWRALLETTATNALCGDGLPFDRSEFEKARDLLIGRGVARWRDPLDRRKGWELTPAMWRAVVRETGGALPYRARPIR